MQYKLNEHEIKEALLCLDYKQESGVRKLHLYIVSGVGGAVFFAYMKRPEQFFFLLLLIVALLFYMSYGSSIRRRRVAKKMMQTAGEYRLELKPQGICYGESGKELLYVQEKVKIIDSKHIYVIKAGREVFSIPKRILVEKQCEELEKIIQNVGGNVVRITIEEE